MKIVFVTSECAPFSKSGGLADVAYSLPPTLKAAGHEICVFTPLYQCVNTKFKDSLTYEKNLEVHLGSRVYHTVLKSTLYNGVKHCFLEYDAFFNRERLYGYDDDKQRFALFSKAVIDAIFELDFVPDIIHCNDWETALSIIYLKNEQATRPELLPIKSVYTIHNIAYQGQFGIDDLTTTFALPEGWYEGGLAYEYQGRHDINLMKGAMLMCDALNTVSPTYAKELHHENFGKGLQGVADIVDGKLRGILNGIDMDLYNPSSDTRIAANFSVSKMKGKAICKEAIQKQFGLALEPKYPLLASVCRLVEQKGIELVKEVLPRLMEMGVQVIVFGQGEQQYIDYFNACHKKWPDQFGFSSDYTEEVASQIFAGADFYLMPSAFEPCGLSQMMAMRYGTIPIVHETGGLKDSVRPYSEFDGVGDGFSFSQYHSKALYLAIMQALKIYFGDEKTFKIIRRRCMTKDLSWDKSASMYSRMYSEIGDSKKESVITFEIAYETLKELYENIDKNNRQKYPGRYPKDLHTIIEIQIVGIGEGVFTIEFSHEGTRIYPHSNPNCDAKVSCGFENLMGIAMGELSADALFINGQLVVEGKIAKGASLKKLLQVG